MAGRICPWWIGYLLACPIRKFFEDPQKIFGDYVKPGMAVLDIGCAMGFFSLSAARMVGSGGHVFAIDIQERMIKSLKRRASRTGLSGRIDARTCGKNSLEIDDLDGQIDLALAFHVVHEVPDVPRLMMEIYKSMKPGALFFVIEPKGHTSVEEFTHSVSIAEQTGFKIVDHPQIKRDRAVLFIRKETPEA